MEKSTFKTKTCDNNVILDLKTFIAQYLEHNKNRLQLLSVTDIKNAMMQAGTNTFTEFFQSDKASAFSSFVEEELLQFALHRIDFVVNEAITKAITDVQNSGHPIYKAKKNKALTQCPKRAGNPLTLVTLTKRHRQNTQPPTTSITTNTPSSPTPNVTLTTPSVSQAPDHLADMLPTWCGAQLPSTPPVGGQFFPSSCDQVAHNIPINKAPIDVTRRKPRRVSETNLHPKNTRKTKRRHTMDL